ncbi:ATP-binding protein [Streptomyces sp. V1I1]|uniref:ATP-binding protein n=1 Tax=Streptomyces sp. V1I1 TaxID=3042272 RepID=UPI00277F3D94|nr:ATP-binding protein [Streptomyces sp. V1I1]MDQ0942780.1 anti-sigma regulatory factor (Ser/Thr protein kinase) [Streptomyces sp. V1I1]
MVYPPEEDYGPLDGSRVETPERAREVTRRFLSVVAPGGGSGADAVVLVVSELVTNAVRHAGGVTGFRLEEGLGTVTVAVQDASPAPPRPRPAGVREPCGFGWHLVRELSADVQVHVHPRGKTVWAAVRLSP